MSPKWMFWPKKDASLFNRISRGKWTADTSAGMGSGMNYVFADSGDVYYCGINDVNRYGSVSSVAELTKHARNMNDVAFGSSHSVALIGGYLFSTGYNLYGQLGLGDTVDRADFEQIGTFSDWNYVYCSRYSSYAIRNGDLYVWGLNVGQFGLGHSTDLSTPTLVDYMTGWEQICMTGFPAASWGIADGKIYSTGWPYGASFAQRTEFTDWTKISAGNSYFYYALRDGRLYSWGYDNERQLGIFGRGDDWRQVHLPEPVGTDTDWEDIACGANHGMALKDGGQLMVTGTGSSNKNSLGLGSTLKVTYFTPVPGMNHCTDISAPQDYSIAIQAGDVYVCGHSGQNQIGIARSEFGKLN